MTLINKIKQLAERNKNEIIEIRRHLHQYPELSFNETKTSEFICKKLTEFDIPYKTGFCKTGIIADINPGKQGKMIALRSDIDALPVEEKNTFYFKSKHKGIMHACGHDLHIASLLGTAKILKTLQKEINGTVRLIFQPGEEKIPGGALQMLKEGIFKDREPDFVIAQHSDPAIETGKIGIKQGLYMASTDEIYITVKGNGGHAAMPDIIDDTVHTTAQIITSLQQIVSRRANPATPTVLSFGKIIADGATNIIPNKVIIEGTFRTYDELWRNKAHKLIKQIAESTAKSSGVQCSVIIKKGYPYLNNDKDLTKNIRELSSRFLGKEGVLDLNLRMTSEDFSYFSQKYPSVLYRIGTGNKTKKTDYPLHSENFNIDEDALSLASGLMAWNTVMLLNL